jgi:hypothetical protein
LNRLLYSILAISTINAHSSATHFALPIYKEGVEKGDINYVLIILPFVRLYPTTLLQPLQEHSDRLLQPPNKRHPRKTTTKDTIINKLLCNPAASEPSNPTFETCYTNDELSMLRKHLNICGTNALP